MQREFANLYDLNNAEEITPEVVATRGVEAVLPDAAGLIALMLERPIKLYLGIDATSPYLHIGHTVVLRKLRQLQLLGHNVNLLFGGFTSLIGDPTDKAATRKMLTPEQVRHNMNTYAEQAGKVLDLTPQAATPVNIVNNNDWLGPMDFAEVIKYAAQFTVQQVEERDVYRRRRAENKPIGLHEFLYVLMQAIDSVKQGVDCEVGGDDQRFNMLQGRTLMDRILGRQKWVIAMKLLMDASGAKKMGKSDGNVLNVVDPAEYKFEALMTWPDGTVPGVLESLTYVPMPQVTEIGNNLEQIKLNQRGSGIVELRKGVAYRVVSELDGGPQAEFAQDEYERVQKGELPKNIREVKVEPHMPLKQVLVLAGLASDEEQAGRKIKEGTVYADGVQIKRNVPWSSDYNLLSIGKRTVRNIRRVTT